MLLPVYKRTNRNFCLPTPDMVICIRTCSLLKNNIVCKRITTHMVLGIRAITLKALNILRTSACISFKSQPYLNLYLRILLLVIYTSHSLLQYFDTYQRIINKSNGTRMIIWAFVKWANCITRQEEWIRR